MRTDDPTDPIDLAERGMPSDNDSLTGVLRELGSAGFAASYRPAREPVEGRAAVVCGSCGQSVPAADLAVVEQRRLEGASDPDDLVLAVAATCPACRTGGVIVLGYGPQASPEDADIVAALHEPVGDDGAGSVAGTGEGSADPGNSDPDARKGLEPTTD